MPTVSARCVLSASASRDAVCWCVVAVVFGATRFGLTQTAAQWLCTLALVASASTTHLPLGRETLLHRGRATVGSYYQGDVLVVRDEVRMLPFTAVVAVGAAFFVASLGFPRGVVLRVAGAIAVVFSK